MNDHPAIFLVDDEPAVRDSMWAVLQECGYNAICIASLEEFLNELACCSTGCLVIDSFAPTIKLPELLYRLDAVASPLSVIIFSETPDLWTQNVPSPRDVILLDRSVSTKGFLNAVETQLTSPKTP